MGEAGSGKHKIFCLMGKSASGKDTFYKKLMTDEELGLHAVVIYTTRPMREGEKEGREYFFRTQEAFEKALVDGQVIEYREYQTVHGQWIYYTMDDGQIDPAKGTTLLIGTPQSCRSLRAYYGADAVVPLYLQVEDGERLQRALDRERGQKEPKYAELCRRFLADEKDFAPEELSKAGVDRIFENKIPERCLQELRERILQG